MNRCYECTMPAEKDGFCESHWNFLFAGMNNRQRMAEKKKLREMRRERAKALENVSR
jgi:hypothetical protein